MSRPDVIAKLAEPLAVALFGHDCNDSALNRRAVKFQSLGARVVGFTFQRQRAAPPLSLTWRNIPLGTTVDRNYLARLPRLVAGLWRAYRERQVLRRADVIYARNIDMLALAIVAKGLSGARAAIVYEVLDVQRVFVGNGLVNRVFRWCEARLLRRCALLVVSSPDFMSEYFVPVQRYAGAWHLLENKVPIAPPESTISHAEPTDGAPWVIGWLGVLRCRRSLQALCDIADHLGSRVEVYIRGRPSLEDLPLEELVQACDRLSNMTYAGPYRSPEDLADIYGRVHFAWCFDFLDAGTNSDWLLPNRLYEGGLYGALALAHRRTATGRAVERLSLGWSVDEPIADTVADLIGRMTPAAYADAHAKAQGQGRAAFVDETDSLQLLERLVAITRSGGRVEGPPRATARASDVIEATTQ